MDIVVLFPGQGSQKPGMGRDLAEKFPEARAVFDAADAALGESLSTLCFDGPADRLTLTHNAQPALLTHGAAAWRVVEPRIAGHVRAAAGHSLGEFTAYHAVGSLSFADAVRLVRRRGELMYESGVARPGAMAAILGDTNEDIDAICAKASSDAEGGLVVAANYNSPGQVVISGEVAGVERAMELCKTAGAKRAMRLPVSGAFHSPLMAPASDGLRAALDAVSFGNPSVPVYANVTAAPVTTGDEARALCVEQLTSPVRWTDLILRLTSDFPDALYLELGPGSVLGGLVKKINPAVKTAACGTVADIEQLFTQVFTQLA